MKVRTKTAEQLRAEGWDFEPADFAFFSHPKDPEVYGLEVMLGKLGEIVEVEEHTYYWRGFSYYEDKEESRWLLDMLLPIESTITKDIYTIY